MCASVRIEGKRFEVSGVKGATLPFRVAEVSKGRVFVINLQLDEFRWLAREMVRFCSSKGEPLWVRTFRGSNHSLLLQMRKNKRGRFIVFSHLRYSGKSRTIIFPEGPKADGWFGITKLLKETLIGASKASPAFPKEARKEVKGWLSKPLSYANVVKGASGAMFSGQLKGWRCRSCGSWDVYAAVLGDERVSTPLINTQREHVQGMPASSYAQVERGKNMDRSSYKGDGSRLSSLARIQVSGEGSKGRTQPEKLGVPSPGANQFQALRDLLENYPDSDSCSTSSTSPRYHSLVPDSPPSVVQLQRHSSNYNVRDCIVYSRRKNVQNKNAFAVGGNDCLGRNACGMGSDDVGQLVGQNVQVSGSARLSNDGSNQNLDRGSAWVLDHIIPMCKKMGLSIEGRESELLAFLASLEVQRRVGNSADVQLEVEEEAGGDDGF